MKARTTELGHADLGRADPRHRARADPEAGEIALGDFTTDKCGNAVNAFTLTGVSA